MSSATVTTGIDSYVASDHASTNYGTAKSMIIRDPSSGVTAYGFLWLKSPAPPGATIISAMLRLFGKGTFSSLAVTAARIAASWSESKLTYTNRPTATGTTVTVTQANTDGAEWDFDVTALFQTISNGAANYGLRLTTTGTRAEFYSLNSGVFRPQLDVTWSDAPNTPHTLSPSGGRSVSIAKPVVRCDYVDVSGSTQMAAIQVQIDAAGNFVTPGFDSGTVAASLPELDLSTTAYAGLTAGTSTQWRVRVQDAAGIWSGWSDPATFARTAKATLTITNPAAPASNFVSESTPPISWTFTGQTAYRVQISLDSDPAHPILDTGKITATTTTYTLPAKVLTVQGATYRVTVDAWDAVSREATPGDLPNVEAFRAFFFNLSATVATVTSLTAVPDATGLPAMVLTWNRSTAPDSFAITRDGSFIAANIVPADVFVSGTQYRYTDRGVAPNLSHTWSVQAVVNGITSASNPTATAQTKGSTAVWLSSPNLGLFVPVVITGQAAYDMPETAAVYYPVGPGAAVRVTQGRRGLEGSISGRITTYAGTPAATWVTNMLTFKAQPDTELYLLMGAQALRVVIGAVVLAPLDKGRIGDRACSFSFWSLDPAA